MKFSPSLVTEICKYVEAGNSHKDSAALCDISEKTFYQWQKEHSEFSESLKKSELKCKARNIMFIQQAAQTTWQANCWLLERRYNSEWGANHDIMDRLTIIEKKLQDLEVKK